MGSEFGGWVGNDLATVFYKGVQVRGRFERLVNWVQVRLLERESYRIRQSVGGVGKGGESRDVKRDEYDWIQKVRCSGPLA